MITGVGAVPVRNLQRASSPASSDKQKTADSAVGSQASTASPILSGLGASTLARISVDRAIEELVPESALNSGGKKDSKTTQASSRSSTGETAALDDITKTFQQRFAQQAGDKEAFHALMQKSFGDSYDVNKAESIRQQTLAGDFSWMPKVELVDGAQLSDVSGQQTGGVGLGAYSKDNDTIYLSRDLLSSDPAKAEQILTEEVGHGLDVRLNKSDAAGDEGAIFSKLSHGETISASELSALKSENDSGTIVVNGKEIEVEYGFFKKLGRSISKGVRGIGRSIRKGIKGVARAVKKGFNKIMQSKIFGVILSVARFIPIPVVQAAAYALSAVRAAYSIYQGVKHGSAAAILGGVAGLAGGVAKFGGAINSTGSWVSTAAKIANTAGTASRAYAVVAQKDVGAALSFLTGQVDKDSQIAGLLKTAQSANAVYQAKRSGGFLGAVGAGAVFLQDFTGPAGDKLLDDIATKAGTAQKLKVAFEKGDVPGALQILDDALGDKSALRALGNKKLETVSETIGNLLKVKTFVENREYASGASLLLDTVNQHAPNSATATTLNGAAQTLRSIDSAIQAARDGNITRSSDLFETVLGRPIDEKTRAVVESLHAANLQVKQFSEAVKSGDADSATQILDGLVGNQIPGVVNIFHSAATSAILVDKLEEALSSGQHERAADLTMELVALSDNATVKDGLQRLSTVLEGKIMVSSGHSHLGSLASEAR